MLGLRPRTPQDYPEWSGFSRRREREWLERIGRPDLSRIRRYDDVIRLRGVEIDHANNGEAVEDERQGPSGEEVGFVREGKMQVGAQRSPNSNGIERAGLLQAANQTDWEGGTYAAK